MSLISVIMPVFNCEQYIGTSIDSVCSQDYSDWELIIVDDGSTDGTKSILSKFQHPRIRTITHTENLGVSRARNSALESMSGDFFCFLDADDCLPPESLRTRVALFDSDKSLLYVDGMVEVMNQSLNEHISFWNPKFKGSPFKDLASLSGASFYGITWMIKRRPGFRYRFREGQTHAEDLQFYIDLAWSGGMYSYVNEVIYKVRNTDHGTSTELESMEKGYKSILKDLREVKKVDYDVSSTFDRRARRVMSRSYLSQGRIMEGITTALFSWNNKSISLSI